MTEKILHPLSKSILAAPQHIETAIRPLFPNLETRS